MKKSLFVIASLVVSATAFADATPVRGLPLPSPCRNAAAEDAAKETLAAFETFYRAESAKHKAPVPRYRASEPKVGTCSPRNLRDNAGQIMRGIRFIPPTLECGVKYTFKTEAALKKFSQWALESIHNNAVETSAPICAFLAASVPSAGPHHPHRPILGMPIHH